ncbi:MAG TPA: hypothetical protein VGR57_01805 [Ktedonobacterales bacterium]|nr:hypothetical protein [Ktedonobacterales bacterium]
MSNDVSERRAVSRALATLAATKHAEFTRLCHSLLDDPELRVREEILWHLMRYGHRDDVVAETKARALLALPDLRGRALLALGTVGTRSVVPELYVLSEASEQHALVALARQVRAESQRRQALRLSRKWLTDETYSRRDEALRALRILSTARREEDLLLTIYLKYGDELVVWALGAASAHMLPVLRDLRGRWPEGCAEHGDVTRAMRRLEWRLAHHEAKDHPKGAGGLREYL